MTKSIFLFKVMKNCVTIINYPLNKKKLKNQWIKKIFMKNHKIIIKLDKKKLKNQWILDSMIMRK